MPDNIGLSPALYDDPDLFLSYQQTRAVPGRLNELVELPALLSLLPPLGGIDIADLGCGAGAMCRRLAKEGANVWGYDPSERMLDVARSETEKDLCIRYECVAIEQKPLREQSVDLVISGLALHYVADFSTVASHVATALRPGGSFVFSVEHPLLTCDKRQWHSAEDGSRLHWRVDRYLLEGQRHVSWLNRNDIPRYHRTVSTYINALLEAGLILKRVLEPGPDSSDIDEYPRLADQLRRPPFLIIRADKAKISFT